jgi:hypothetical protein
MSSSTCHLCPIEVNDLRRASAHRKPSPVSSVNVNNGSDEKKKYSDMVQALVAKLPADVHIEWIFSRGDSWIVSVSVPYSATIVHWLNAGFPMDPTAKTICAACYAAHTTEDDRTASQKLYTCLQDHLTKNWGNGPGFEICYKI